MEDNSRLPKILLFYQDFGEMGGIERYLIQTARLLRERGNFHPVVVCCAGTPLFQKLQADNVSVYGLPWRSGVGKLLGKSFLRTLDVGTLFRLMGILRAERPAVVHTHIGLVENLLFPALGYPVVLTFHGYGTLYSLTDAHFLKRSFKRLTRRLFRLTARHLDALLFVSQAEQRRMVDEGYLPAEARAETLWNGLSPEVWRNAAAAANPTEVKERLGIPPEARCIGFINRMDAAKNPDHVLALADRLRTRHGWTDLYVLLAGDGSLATDIREACAASEHLRYLGHYDHVPELLATLDLLIYPARRDGFGLGLLEAMAVGTPCLAYDSGGVSEILDAPGARDCLVPPDNLEQLARKTEHLLRQTPEERAALSAALRERAETFGEVRFIEGLEAVYRRFAPTVSVILPVYNGEATILRAIRSVLAQTVPVLELLIVDDGSTDRTPELLAALCDPRVKVLSQENQGVATARNLAFRHARGEYLAFIDADDCWLPEKLAVELATLRRHRSPDCPNPPECIVYSSYYAVDERDRLANLPPIHDVQGDVFRHALEREGLFLPSTALVHRAVMERTGGFKTGCYHEDRAFFIEACRHVPAYPTGKRLVLYRQSLSGRCRRVLQDYDAALTAERSIVDTLRSILSDAEAAELALLQERNLLQRFIMYGYLAHARRLYEQLHEPRSETMPGELPLFSGLKGRLAWLSLQSGVNFLLAARVVQQAVLGSFAGAFARPLASPASPQSHIRGFSLGFHQTNEPTQS